MGSDVGLMGEGRGSDVRSKVKHQRTNERRQEVI